MLLLALLWREELARKLDGRGNWSVERNVTTNYKEGEPPGSFTLVKRRKITFYW